MSHVIPTRAVKARICMPTARKFARKAFRCGLYEAQDVLSEIDNVDLIGLHPSWGFRSCEKWLRRFLYHDRSRKLMFLNPGLQKVRLSQEYDLFVAVCQDYWDLPYFNAIEGWKDNCKTSVCWIDELWAAVIPGYKYWLDALSQFDHIFVGCRGSVATLSDAIGRSCRWLPGGVDTLRFNPYPNPPARVIDVYSMGRRWEGIHQALLQGAEQGEIFYVHDTFSVAGDREVSDHRQHRDMFANVAKRSRYFVVAPGKMDDPETAGQMEIGYRYYEGAAAGTVMIGQQPNCETFKETFDWPDAVLPIQPDGSDVIELLTRLDSEPERTDAISRRNATGALLHHDWAYRWKEILRVAGLEPLPNMTARERRLKSLADLTVTEKQGVGESLL